MEAKPEDYTGNKYMKQHIYERYRPVYEKAASYLGASRYRVVDLGCGVGYFAKICKSMGLDYIGIDFSEQMIEKAMSNCPNMYFVLGNLLDEHVQSLWAKDKIFVVLETLEHIERDIDLLQSIPVGSQVIISVPSFNAKTHVRVFKNTGEIIKRYSKLLKFNNLYQHPWKNDKKVFICNCERVNG